MAKDLPPDQGKAGDALAQANTARTRGTAGPDEQRRAFWVYGSGGLSYALVYQQGGNSWVTHANGAVGDGLTVGNGL